MGEGRRQFSKRGIVFSPTGKQAVRGAVTLTTIRLHEHEPMSESRLISFEEAGRLLGGLHSNTVRQRKGGTDNLTHVPGFGRRVMLIREEVEKLVDLKILHAQAAERERRKILRLVS
jgi:hypothetical protein